MVQESALQSCRRVPLRLTFWVPAATEVMHEAPAREASGRPDPSHPQLPKHPLARQRSNQESFPSFPTADSILELCAKATGMTSRKILFYIPGAVYGGAHNQVAQLKDRLSDVGYESIVLLPLESGDARVRLEAVGVEVRTATLRRLRATRNPSTNLKLILNWRRQLRDLATMYREVQADIVQIHGITSIDGLLAAKRCGLPVVWQLLDTRAPKALRAVLAPFLRKADCVMAVGHTIVTEYPGLRAIEPIVFYPPVPSSTFHPDTAGRMKARAALGVTDDQILVGSVGNFNPQKDHVSVLHAARQAIDVEPKVVVKVRGAVSPAHADRFDELRRLAETLNLPENTVATLETELTVAAFYQALDVFVLMGGVRSEGVPTVLLEAMATGVPLVASVVGGIPELLNASDGLGVKVGDATGLANGIVYLAGSPGRRHQMRAAGLESFASQFSMETTLVAYLTAYTDALNAQKE